MRLPILVDQSANPGNSYLQSESACARLVLISRGPGVFARCAVRGAPKVCKHSGWCGYARGNRALLLPMAKAHHLMCAAGSTRSEAAK